MICSAIFLWVYVLCIPNCIAIAYESTRHPQSEERETTTRPLSVLLVVPPFAGHLMPFTALGEELVGRGHNVTVATSLVRDSDLVTKTVEKSGFHLWSIGEFFITAREMTELLLKTEGQHMLHIDLLLKVSTEFQKRALETIDNPTIKSYDILVGDGPFCYCFLCLSHKWNIPVVTVWASLSLSPYDLHAWSYPMINTGYTDNLSFFQRLIVTIQSWSSALAMDATLPRYYSFVSKTCDESFHQFLHAPGVYLPQIITASFGFEFPRVSLPLTEYVGPLFPRSQPQLPPDVGDWLEQMGTRSVVYVSMGTTGTLTKDRAEAIINGAIKAGYSVVWSLRKSNQDILDAMTFDRDKVFIASWVPQLSLLRHPSIHSAVLHGGLGGIQEALSCRVPVIAIPFVNDQLDNAVRVQHYHYGELIAPDELTASLVEEKLKLVGSEEYRKALRRIQGIYKKDGGAARAADLVEFYSEFGYEHLIPAYAKYNWSWVQFYNADVYLVLALALFILGYLLYRLVHCCCFAALAKLGFSKRKVD